LSSPTGDGFFATKTKTPATYTSAGAADIVLSKPCKVKTIEAEGVLIPGGAVSGVTVYVYDNQGGLPGSLIHKAKTTGNFATGNFVLTMKRAFKIPAGTFWVSVQATGEQATNSWYWQSTSNVQNTVDVWENPGGAFNHCPTWGTLLSCFSDNFDYLLQIN
jgi:hypothetical protein